MDTFRIVRFAERWTAARLCALLLALSALIAMHAANAAVVSCTPDPGYAICKAYTYSSGDQAFAVPAAITSVRVKVWGAGGGGSIAQASNIGAPGGSGGYVEGVLAVTPASQYVVMTGSGGGGDGTAGTSAACNAAYGFGGACAPKRPTNFVDGGGGGGLSGLFTGSAAVTASSSARAVFVAGGGGSGEGTSVCNNSGQNSSAAGGAGGNSFAGTLSTMQGQNGAFNAAVTDASSTGGGGGYAGGAATNRLSNCAVLFASNGGSNFIAASGVSGAVNLAGNEAAVVPDFVANNPPSTSAAQYVAGVGVGQTTLATAGGNGLVVIEFAEPTVVIAKQSVGGVGTFNYTLTGLNNATDSLTTVTPGTTVTSSHTNTGTAGTLATLTEAAAAGYNTSISCVDANASTDGVGAGSPITVANGNAVTIPAASMAQSAAWTCTYTNTSIAVPPQQCPAADVRATQRYWFFGDAAGIDFGVSGTTATAILGTGTSSEGSTVVTDSNGQLQFWSNATTVYDRNNNVMQNGTGIAGNDSAVQSVVAFPALGRPGIYFLVATSANVASAPNGQLSYSIIDVTANGGLGAVTTKNTLLGAANTASEALTAVSNADGTGFWAITMTNNSPNVLAYEFNATGPTTGTAVTSVMPESNLNYQSTIYFSADLTQTVTMNRNSAGGALLRLLGFNATTGQFFEKLSWNDPTSDGDGFYSADFSPAGNYVYLSLFLTGDLYRFKVAGATTGAQVLATRQNLGSVGPGQDGHVRRAADGRMYVANHLSTTLTVVNNPDDPTNPDMVAHGFALASGSDSSYGLPQTVTGCPTPVPSIQVTKQVAGRVATADQFTVSLVSGTTTLTSATTSGSGTVVATTNWPVTPGNTYTIRDAMAAGSTSTLAAYTATISCTDTTTNTPATTTGTGPDWSLNVPGTDSYSCTITNAIAVAGPPFTCSPLGYLFQASGGVESMYTVDLASGATVNLGTLPAGVNAVGFNTLDDYFYGYGGGQIVRINSDRTYTLFGNPPGLPTGNLYDAGDFDTNGHLWMLYTGLPTETWAEVDFAPGSPTFGQVLDSGTVTVAGAFANPGADVSWINGKLYSVGEGSAAGNQNYLLVFDPVAHTVTNLGTVGFSGAIIGATYTDGTSLYAADNTTGKIWRINVTTRATTLVTTGPAAAGNDGARCATAPIPTITVKKVIAEREFANDDFTVSLLSGSTTLTSATTTNPATTATTTNWPVSMGGTYTIRDAIAAGSSGTMAAYNATIACTDDTTGTTVTPGGAAPNWTLNVPGTDSYTCTITNTFKPAATCATSTIFVGQGAPTQLDAETYGSGGATFTPIGPLAAWTYNAISFRTADNYIYGISVALDAAHPVNRLLRINPSTGGVTNLGLIAGMPATGANNGAFDTADNYYVGEGGATAIYKVDLTALTATAITLTPAQTLGVSDFTYANGYLWGLTTNANPETMARINPVNGATAVFPAAVVPSSASGAAWTLGNGNLGFSDNTTGKVYQVAVTNPSGTPTFTLVSSSSGPASGNNDGTSCIAPPTDLQIVKSGPATVLPNGAITWQLKITNNGPTISSGYTVTDAIPAGYTAISATPGCTVVGNAVTCTGGTLDIGASAVITVTATAPGTAQCLTNTATVLGNEAEPAGTQANNTSSWQTCIVPPPAIQLNKALSGNRTSNTDQFTVAVHTGSAAGPVVNSTTNSTTTGSGAIVDPNTGTTGAFAGVAGTTYFLTEAAVGTTNLANYSQTITCTDANSVQTGLPNNAPFAGSLAITPVPNAAIACTLTNTSAPIEVSVTKTANTNTLTPGGTIVYTVTGSNVGTGDAPNTIVSDSIPAGVTSITWTCAPSGGALCPHASGSGAINETVATFPAGSQVVYTVTATVSASPPTQVANTATVTPPTGQCQPSNTPPPCTVTVTVPPVPQTSITKSADTQTLTPGGTIHYTVVVTNTGTVAANNSPVSDPIPTGISTQTWTCVGSGGATCTANGSGAITDTIVTFPAGSFVTYTVTATVSANPPAHVVNTATVDPPGGVCTPSNTQPPCTVTVTVPPVPQTSVTKTADTQTLIPGGTIHYTVTASNTGSVPADGTLVTDTVPAGIASATWTCAPTGGAVCPHASGSGSINETVATFPVGSTVVYTITATVSSNPPASVANTATTTPPGGGLCSPDNTPPPCTVTITVPPVPQTSVTKTADTQTLVPGGTIHYTVTATNTGSVSAANSPISDPLPVGIASATWTCVASGGAVCPHASGSGSINETAATFPAGSSLVYTVTAIVSANPPATVTNTATITPPGGVCTPTNTPPPCTTTITVPPVPQTSITKTADANTLTPSGTIHYTIVVANTGSVDADGSPVSDSVPAGIASATWTCVGTGGAVCATTGSGAIADTIDPFPAGSFVTYTVTATISSNPPASVANTATVDPPGGVCTPNNTPPPCTDTVVIPPVPQTSVTKIADVNTLTPNGTIHYTITVTNTGSVPANSTPVSDPLPNGIASATWTCAGTAGATCAASGSGAITDTIATFPPGSFVIYTVTATISANPPASVSNTVTVDPPGGVCTPDNTPPPCTGTIVVPPVPQVKVTKTADANTLTPNGTIHYTVTVTNNGSVDADGSAVSDPLPVGLASTTWICIPNGGAVCTGSGSGAINDTIDPFPAGSFVTYTVTATISANPPASVANTASVDPPGGGVCTPNDTPPPCTDTVVVPPVPQVSVVKTSDTNTLTPSGTIHYTVTVTNTGSVAANNTPVSDPVPVGIASATWTCVATGGATCTASGSGDVVDTIATFPPSSFVTYTVTATISANPPPSVSNTVTVDPPGGVCTPNDTPPPCTDTIVVPPVPQVSVTKTADTNALTPNGTIHYTVTVTNTGSVAADGASVSDPLPTGLASATWICIPTGGATCTASGSGAIADTITTFPPGTFVTYTVTATISANPPVSVANTVSVDPPGGVCTPGNTPPPCTDTVTVPPVPQVSVTKTADTNTLTPGGTIHYTVTVANTGSVAANNTPVSDPLPVGLASATWVCAPSGGATCTASGNGGITDTLTAFPPGSSVVYTVTAIISANPPATVTNTATVDPPGGVCTPNDTPPPCTVTVTVPPVAQIAITKSASTQTLTPNGTITYTVTVANTGSVAADGTLVSDPVPAGITAATWTCTPSGGANCALSGSGAITDTITPFPAGASAVYTVTATVSANPPATVVNTATASPPDGVCAPNNSAPPCSGSVSVPPVPQTSVTKTADANTLTPNGTIHYTIVATNTGSVAAPNTPVSDPLPTGIASATWNCSASGGALCPNASGSGAIAETIATFPAGGVVTYVVTAVVSANPPPSVINTVTIDPPGGVCTPNDTQPPCTGIVIVPPVPQVSVTKTADTDTLTPNGTIHYTITAVNTGTVPAPNTTVSDAIPTGISAQTWTCAAGGGAVCPNASGSGAINETVATFPASGMLVYTVTATVSANPPATVSNTAIVNPPGGVCIPGDTSPPCTVTVVVPPVPQVSVTKTSNTTTVTPGGTIVYTVTASNVGAVDAPGTLVSDAIPTGITSVAWICAASGGAVCPHASGSGALSETLAVFPAGSIVVYTLTATVSANPPAQVSNTATVIPPTGLCEPNDTPPPCTTTIIVPPLPLVSVTKTTNATTVTPGGTIVYLVTANNIGAVDAPGTLVSDPIPAGIASQTWTCAASGGAVCPNTSGSGALSETLATFPAGSTAVYTVTATVSANPPSQVANTATVTPPTGLCEPNNTPPPCTTTIVVPPGPQVSVTKTTNATAATPNGTIVYMVTASNVGAVSAPSTLVSDPIPSGIASQTWTCVASGGAVCPNASGSGALSETIATFPAGSTVVYTVTGTVSANPPASVVNTATVTPPTGSACQPDNTPPPCTVTVTVPSVPQVAITKSANVASASAGGTVVYTVTASNVGTIAAPNTTISDPIPTGVASQTWTCAPSGGATCAVSGSGAVNDTIAAFPSGSSAVYTVTAIVSANPPAQLTNTATVTPPQGSLCEPGNTAPPCSAIVTVPTSPNVFDPPFITKSVTAVDAQTLRWTIVVDNNQNASAQNTEVRDPIPANMTFVSGQLTCQAFGGTTISSCAFDAGNNRVVVDALMQSDLGNATPATAPNRIVVVFESRYVAAPVPETNTALACWDPANSTTNITRCQQSIQSTATYTPGATTGQPVSVPVDARWVLLLLCLSMVAGAAYTRRRGVF